MRHRLPLCFALSLIAIALAPVRVAGQPSAAVKTAKAWTPPRTPDGQPDLQGMWTNATITPFERPAGLAEKAFLTEEETAALEQQAAVRRENADRPPRPGDTGSYNDFWFDSGTRVVSTRQTSLVVDPPDGRVPLKPEAEQKRDVNLTNADSFETMSPWDRCITRGPGGMFPAGYNNAYQILQTPGYVVIVYEMIHEARIIPLDGRPHVNQGVRQWTGDSRGRWEGRTLVVETTNFNGKGWIATNAASGRIRGVPHSEALHLVERFTRVDADTISYDITIEDPRVYTRSWKVSIPLSRDENYQMFEYACHEGNRAIENTLSAARAEEKAAAEAAKKETAAWSLPRTPDGQPDLQGIWDYRTLTPLERPREFAGKEFFTDEEAAEYEQRANLRDDGRPPGDPRTEPSVHPVFWLDYGKKVVGTKRTSLIVDPPDGRMPALTAEGQQRAAARRAASKAHGPADSPEDRSLWERCITRGLPEGMLPAGYNNNVEFIQTPGQVVILTEMIHDARIVPLDGRSHLPTDVRQWMGDSRGRWDGTTLVVDTTNFSDKANFRGSGASLHLVERFTRVDANTIDYQFTVDDPATWTRPWTVAFPLVKSEGPIYEYACHEGNYALANILSTARAEEKVAGTAAKEK
jgi:hypothetical protein